MMKKKVTIDIEAFKRNADEMMAAYLSGNISEEEKEVFSLLLKTDTKFMTDWLNFLGHFSIHDVLTDFSRWDRIGFFLSAEEIIARTGDKDEPETK